MKILTIALQKDDKNISTSFELIEAAKSIGGEIFTAILAQNAQSAAEELVSRGGGKVIAVSHANLQHFNDELYANVLFSLIEKHKFDLVIGPATFYGKALVSRLAAKFGGRMASDVNSVNSSGESLSVARSHYGGAVISELAPQGGGPFFATVRPKMYPESKEGAGEVLTEAMDDSLLNGKMKIRERKVESSGAVNLNEADIIVAAGRGLKAAENLPLVQELADSMGGAFGASRAIVDAGWTAYSNQVGQTGKTVNPKLYFAVGISGAIQHLVGMRTSQTIVAINKDKDAPIFNVANYGIVGDALEVVPALTKKLKAELQG
ncbi:MAG: electron transfer flavoprotein subunit alpha/FixB family protein [bacterium]|nr:electron transfer flavoprotein subunit alpha/FixB family protein [bacterium]